MENLALRIQSQLKQKGLTQKKFAELIGVQQPSVHKMLSGLTRSPRNLDVIADVLGVNLNWLRTGKGSPELSASVSPVAYEPDNEHFHLLERLDVELGASPNGRINSDFPEVIEKMYLTDFGLQSLVGVSSTKNLKLFTVPTDSMQPTININDVVLVDISVQQFQIDGVYVFLLNDSLYIKRLQKLPNGLIKALSDNKYYEPFDILPEYYENAQIIGKFVKVWKIEKIDL